jgi:hypothetical protein
MSGPMPGSTEESPAVICLRYYGSLEAVIEALKSPVMICLSQFDSQGFGSHPLAPPCRI